MASASTTSGQFTLTAQTLLNGSVGYTLKTPDGTGYLGPGPFTVTAKPGVPVDSTGKPMVGYKYYSIGNDDFILLTEQEGAALIAALPQMVSIVDKELANATTPIPAPAPAPAPTTYKAPPPIDSELAGSPEFQAQAVGNPPVPAAIAAATEQVEGAPLTGPQVITGVDGVEPPPPLAISTIGDAPLVNTDQINADIANIQFQEPDLPDYAEIYSAESQATEQDQANFQAKADWRVRLSLAPDSQYLYNDPEYAGILKPLKETDGVIFPYTPSITVNYAANYEATNIVHSNYKIYQYSGSAVEQVTIACDFTCQDTYEANYLLSVIHFFRSMTKMFYGQDVYPIRGTPPPLCYMFGMGGYQFAAHPLAISSFNYTLPNDVDYIKTVTSEMQQNYQINDMVNAALASIDEQLNNIQFDSPEWARLGDKITKGGMPPPPRFNSVPSDITTWVPTKIQITIGCVPIMSRNQTANYFSLEDYASGRLIKGTSRPGGGFW